MASPYSMTAKDCSLGYPRYWGVNIDANTGQESWTALNPEEYLAYTEGGTLGCPTRGNFIGSGLRRRIEKSWLKLEDVPGYNKIVFEKFKVNPTELESPKFKAAITKILPYRAILVMELRNAGIPVIDPNNIADIINKYIALYKIGGFNEKIANTASPDAPKPKSFDFGAIIGGVVDLIGGIVDGVNSGNVENTIATWTANFQQYMTTDFAAIEAVLQQQGPQAALNKLMDYKNGSWLELKNTMYNYCAQKGKPVPQQFTALIAQQEQLENRIKNLLSTGTGPGPGTGPGNQPPDQGRAFNWWYVIIPLLVIIVVAGVVGITVAINKSNKKKKSSATAA